MSHHNTVRLIAAITSILLAVAFAGCGRGEGDLTSATAAPPSDAALDGAANPACAAGDAAGTPTALAEAMTAIKASETPPGVDPGLWVELTAELMRVLSNSGARDITMHPPEGEHNHVRDLWLTEDGEGGWRLEWSYVNVGDYNHDGLVGVSDLTPIGQYYEVADGDPDWAAASVADGNRDGMVTVNDITPIGQNFMAFVEGYDVYGSTDGAGAWEQVNSQAYAQEPELSVELGATEYFYFQVAPTCGETEGVRSGSASKYFAVEELSGYSAQITSLADGTYQPGQHAQSLAQLAVEVAQQPYVREATDLGNALWVVYTDGFHEYWLFPEEPEGGVSSVSAISPPIRQASELVEGNSLVILDPEFGPSATPVAQMTADFQGLGYSVTVAAGSDCDLDAFLDLAGASVIVIITHGFASGPSPSDRMWILTGDEVDPDEALAYEIARRNDPAIVFRLAPVNWSGTQYWQVSDLWFRHEYQSKPLNHGIVYNGACQGLYKGTNTSMAKAFTTLGMACYLGWTDNQEPGPDAAAALFHDMSDSDDLATALAQLPASLKTDGAAQLVYYPASGGSVQIADQFMLSVWPETYLCGGSAEGWHLDVDMGVEYATVAVVAEGAEDLKALFAHIYYDRTKYTPIGGGPVSLGGDINWVSAGGPIRDRLGRIAHGQVLAWPQDAAGLSGNVTLAELEFHVSADSWSPPGPRAILAPVDRLVLNSEDGLLSWTCGSGGDYNQDGKVFVDDLIPLAMYIGEFPGELQHPWVDGNQDGAITISDLTPMTMNMLASIDAYYVYMSMSRNDHPDGGVVVREVEFGDGWIGGDGWLSFICDLGATVPEAYYWVRSACEDSLGAASDYVHAPPQE